MKLGRKFLIFYVLMMFLTAGCSSNPLTYEEWEHRNRVFNNLNENARSLAEAAERFDSIGRDPNPQQLKPATRCRSDYAGGFICN
jgi:PBP1b-binding outer membrane lipoprotein LpoB